MGLATQAYQVIDVNRTGQVPVEELIQLYDAPQHPDVKNKAKTAGQVDWSCYLLVYDIHLDHARG